MTDKLTAAQAAIAKFRAAFIVAVGDKSPFAQVALAYADEAEASIAAIREMKGEPVAWQTRLAEAYRPRDGSGEGWDHPSIACPTSHMNHPAWEVRALYTHPPAKAEDSYD